MNTTENERNALQAKARNATMFGDWQALREIILSSGIGTVEEQYHVVAEWQAEYDNRTYSPFPRYAAPRQPRPLGYYEED